MPRTKPMPWFRLHAEFATDPKVQAMSEALQRRFIMLLCLRCSGNLADLDSDEMCFALHVSEEDLAETKRVFLKKGFIDDGWNIANWEWRQFKSDSSADRTKAYRDRLNQKAQNDEGEKSPKQSCDNDVTSQDRHSDDDACHYSVQSTDIQNTEVQNTEVQSTEKKQVRTSAHANAEPLTAAQQKTCFDEFYKTYPRKVGKPAAQTKFNQKIKTLAKFSEVMHALANQKQTDVFNGPRQFIPHPATWLNQERWEDDPNELNNEVDHATHQRQLEKLSPCERLAYERQQREQHNGNVYDHKPDFDALEH